MKRTNWGRLGIATVTAVMLAATAHAVPITGTIIFGGAATPIGGTGTFSDAVGVDIFGDIAAVGFGNGSFAGLSGTASFQDFLFSYPPVSAQPLWAVGGFSFDLNSISLIAQSANFANANGTGVLRGPAGYDDTAANWSFSIDHPVVAEGQTATIWAFSSQTAASSPVPEPGTMILLGSGLLGLAGFVRRRTI